MKVNFLNKRNKWKIVTVYSQNIEETLDTLMEEINEEEEGYLILGGDFNARTGEEGGPIGALRGEEKELRKSKDKVINKEGRTMISKIKERGWMIINGSFKKEGDWTYIGEMDCSIIDYALTNEKALEEIISVKEGERTESDHVPIEVILEGTERRRGRSETQREVSGQE